jgi:hypothetical protein
MTDQTATNDITGARIASKTSRAYTANYGGIDFNVKLEAKDHNNHLLNDPIDGFNNNSNGQETANLASENNLRNSQNGSTITQNASG